MKFKTLKTVGYAVSGLFIAAYYLVLSVDARSWGDSLNSCDLGPTVIENLIWGAVVFALHGPIFGWFFKRQDGRFFFGLALGLLPGFGAFCILMYYGCSLAPGTLKFLILACLPMFLILCWLFYHPIESSFPPFSMGRYYALPVIHAFTISIPFLGPIYLLNWIAFSWGLPALFALTWQGKENPPGIRDKIFWIFLTGGIVSFWSSMAYLAYF